MPLSRYGSVTTPILLPCSAEDGDGIADVGQGDWRAVRGIGENDLFPKSAAWNALSRREREMVTALSEFKASKDRRLWAYAYKLTDDEPSPTKSAKLQVLEGSYKHPEHERLMRPIAKPPAEVASRTEAQLRKLRGAIEKLPTKRFSGIAARTLAAVATGALSRTRFVPWYDGRNIKLALYCPNPATALFAHVLLSEGKGLRFCPECGEAFFQDDARQIFCKPRHREKNRQKRFRKRHRR